MDLDLSDDQELLRETTARFIEAACPLPTLRGWADDERGFGDGYLTQAAELGWFAMLVDEAYGGGSVSGSGVRDAAIIAEERGRLVQPGPFVPANVAALALSRAGSDTQRAEHLDGLVAGATIVTWGVADAAGAWEPGAGLDATVNGDRVVLQGAKGFVQDAHLAAAILVTASSGEGLRHVLVPTSVDGVSVRRLESLDITRRLCRVDFDGVELPVTSLVGAAGAPALELFEQQLQTACVLTMAETIGALSVLFEMIVDYVKARTAFGRPVGSFQAIKHLLADTGMLLEMSKAMSVAATRAVADATPDAAEVVSMAKSFVGDNSVQISHNCFQAFGGIAYTWEHDQHLYFRRVATDSVLYGEPAWHRERICSLHNL